MLDLTDFNNAFMDTDIFAESVSAYLLINGQYVFDKDFNVIPFDAFKESQGEINVEGTQPMFLALTSDIQNYDETTKYVWNGKEYYSIKKLPDGNGFTKIYLSEDALT